LKKVSHVLVVFLFLISMCSCSPHLDPKSITSQDVEPLEEGVRDLIQEEEPEKGNISDSEIEEDETPETTQQEITEDYVLKYNVSINPEFVVYADAQLAVVDIEAANDDAKVVLETMGGSANMIGATVQDAFNTIKDEAKEQGYMSEEQGNTMNITILENNDESLKTCHVCGGCGTVVCPDCNGTGIGCQCDWCKGAGIITHVYLPNTNGTTDCWSCRGSGICPDCDGCGYNIVTNGGDNSIKYISPGVPETSTCIACSGTGVCGNCHGEEYGHFVTEETVETETCTGCNGAGVLYCHDDLNGYSWCPCCWGSGIDGTGDPDYND